jgi:hypothetical protein
LLAYWNVNFKLNYKCNLSKLCYPYIGKNTLITIVALSWGFQILNNIKHVTYIIFCSMANSIIYLVNYVVKFKNKFLAINFECGQQNIDQDVEHNKGLQATIEVVIDITHGKTHKTCNTSRIRTGISSLPPACWWVLSNCCKTTKKKLKCFDLCGRTSRTHGMLKNTSMDRASMGYLASSKDLCWWMWRFCFVSNFSKKIDRCQETLLVWHLSFVLKLKSHEVIMSLIRLSHTNEVECKSIARDRIRCTWAMKHQMHDIMLLI